MDGDTVGFALTRCEAVDGARLELEGTWTGVRGVRFVRPALVVHREGGGERTLLAVLEHKPWPAQEGEPWVAAFPWDGGDLDMARTELAVAPSIVVPLDGARTEEAIAEVDREPSETRRGRPPEATAEVRTRAAEARARPAREVVRRELRERDEAVKGREAARAERDAALAARDEARAECDALRQRLLDREQSAAGAAKRREQALAERDEARRERERVIEEAERRADARAAEAVERERRRAAMRIEELEAALMAVEAERDRALTEPAGVVSPPVRAPREHGSESAHADWAARTAAIVALLVLLVLAVTLLKAVG